MNETFLKQQLRTAPETDWAIGILILVSVLYIISRLVFPRYHSRISHAFFNRYEANKLISERNVLFNNSGFLLNLIPLFCVAMIVFEQRAYFNPETQLVSPFLKYLGILIAVTVYFGGRIMILYLFGLSFEKQEIALRFNQVYVLHFENMGTYILIPALALPFAQGIVRLVLMISLWTALAFWVIFTMIRELEILKSYRVSIFYMFLYLCTLEILPLWWAVISITEGW